MAGGFARDERGRFLGGRNGAGLTQQGGAGNGLAVDATALDRAKSAVRELGKDVSKLASEGLPGLGQGLQAIVSGDIVGGIRSVGSAFAEAFTQVGQLAGQLSGLASLTGSTSAQMQGLAHAAGLAGVDIGSLKGELTGLSARMYSVTTGSVDAILAFSRLGVAVGKSGGGFRSATDVYDDVVAKLIAIKDPVERAGKALAVGLPQALETANRFLAKGGDAEAGVRAYRAAQAEVKSFGATISESTRRAAAEFGDTQAKLGLISQGYRNALVAPLYDAFSVASSKFVEISKAQAETTREAYSGMGTAVGKLAPVWTNLKALALSLVPAFGSVVETFAAVASAVGTVAVTVGQGLVNAFNALGPTGTALAAGLFASFFPLTALFTGIALVVEDLIVFARGGKSAFGDALAAFGTFKEKLASGDFLGEGAFGIRFAKQLLNLVLNEIPAAIEYLASIVKDLLGGAFKAVESAIAPVNAFVDKLIAKIEDVDGQGAISGFLRNPFGAPPELIAQLERAGRLPPSPTAPVTPPISFSPSVAGAAGAALTGAPVVTVNLAVNAGLLGSEQAVTDKIKDTAKEAFTDAFRSAGRQYGVQ